MILSRDTLLPMKTVKHYQILSFQSIQPEFENGQIKFFGLSNYYLHLYKLRIIPLI